MAATYYVDIANPGTWNGRTGLDETTNLLLGLLGLQYAIDTAVVTDTVKIRGIGDGGKVYSVPYDNSSGTFTAGEGVSWAGGTGVIYEGLAATPCRIELLTGDIATNDETITGATSGATCDVNGSATISYTIDFNTNSGSATTGFIKYIGVPAGSWTPDGTLAVLDGQGLGTTKTGFMGNNKNYLWFENLKPYDCTSSGWAHITANSNNNIFINCHSVANDSYGFTGFDSGSIWIRCSAYGNGNHGFYPTNTPAKFIGCASAGNAGDGFNATTNVVLVGCQSFDNTGANSDGYALNGLMATLLFSVADNNAGEGVECNGTNGTLLLLGNRFTENGHYGIDGSSRVGVYGWNYMPGDSEARDNATDQLGNATMLFPILTAAGVDTNNLAGTDAAGGYVDPTNKDFNVTSTAALRRQAISLVLETDGLT